MKILVFGSLNLDYVYHVPHFVHPGETLAALNRSVFPGGKGLNQCIALSRAGMDVYMAGAVGEDDTLLVQTLAENGVDTSFITRLPVPTGHAVIEVDALGENRILLFGGANRSITPAQIDRTLSYFEKGDCLVLQNEISALPYLIDTALSRGLSIALNPAPMQEDIKALPLSRLHTLIINRTEAAQLCDDVPDRVTLERALSSLFPHVRVVLTMGCEGAVWLYEGARLYVPAQSVPVADTTGAGDTFAGYYLAAAFSGVSPKIAMEQATCAAALCVMREGAAASIPYAHELMQFWRD